MAKSTGPMLAVTGISFANQWLGNNHLDIKILVAGGVATVILAGVEQIPGAQPIAVGIAWITFITLMITGYGGGKSPVQNLQKLTGL
jgi:hypothetical protein